MSGLDRLAPLPAGEKFFKKNFPIIRLTKPKPFYYLWTASFGGMAEWLKAHAWKACLLNCNEGSNPSPSSKLYKVAYVQSSRLP